jgi:hypothetical protein
MSITPNNINSEHTLSDRNMDRVLVKLSREKAAVKREIEEFHSELEQLKVE